MKATVCNIKIGIKVVLFFFALFLALGSTTAATLTVSNSEEADYTSIQKAIDSASEGDTILVSSGTYIENLVITKSLILKSVSGIPEYTIIESSNPKDHVFNVTADSVNISGFTITGSSSPYAGISFYGCDNSTATDNKLLNNNEGIWLDLASGCRIHNNIANSNKDSGIFLYDSKDNIIENNTLNLNEFSGISLNNCSKNILKNNRATQNKIDGIFLVDSSSNLLLNNSVNSSEFSGITLSESNYNEMKNNSVYSNWNCGFSLVNSSNNILTGNDAEKNNFGVFLKNSTNNTVEGNEISENSEGVCLQSASGNKLYSNKINFNEWYGIDTCECKDNNTYSKNQIKSNYIGFYIDKSNDNITEDNLLEGNEKDIEKSRPTKPVLTLLIIGVTLIFVIIIVFVFLKHRNSK